ncbi:cobalt-precorrin 5A hydrolase [Kushneria sinocarnis]|uniref:Cobalt-precorrin 5A hydrolase n=2 Tax=Kushneria sinocarnis TaxID=595502 RepID=A0A420WYG1_9GAMM|nr:cobalt-precorrin 5A hydrolase [Kushneria sinocarnis]
MGCRRGCTVEALESLMLACLARHGWPVARVAALATLNDKCREPGLRQLAARYRWPLLGFEREQLDSWRQAISRPSTAAARHMAVTSVAEAAALAGCRQLDDSGHVTLLGPRQQSDRATAALAATVFRPLTESS